MGGSGDRGRRLLVLGAGPPQLDLIEAAHAAGIWLAVCDRDPAAPGFRLADRRCIVSVEDEPAIERLAAALALDGVVAPGRDRSTAVAARIAEKLGVPHPLSPACAALTAQRLRQRDELGKAGIPQPRWQTAADRAEVGLSLPLVVKLVDRAGQTQLELVEDEDSLEAALTEARELARSGPLLLEEFVHGPEVTVSGCSLGGEYVPLVVSDHACAEPPAFGVPLEESWPSAHAQPAAELARRSVEALGISEGPSHVRVRFSGGGPEVLQVSARLGANHEAALVELVTGVDLARLAVCCALGSPFDGGELPVPREGVGAAVIRFLVAPEGILEAVEAPQGQKGVVRTWIYREPGHVFGPLRRPSDRAGALLVSGATLEEAHARADAAVESIRFRMADAGALV